MHLYDSLIIGSGYSSVGFALKRQNCLICEETHCCDTHFYLPLKSFIHSKYTPVTEFGKKLNSVFEKYDLFNNNFMCTNCFEPAFCEFISKENIDVILKCRVVDYKKLDNGSFEVTILTAEGLSTVYAKNRFDTVTPTLNANKYITVLFVSTNAEADIDILSKEFEGSTFTNAFYESRYVMHLPVDKGNDVNEVLSCISDKWETINFDAKILYVPPVLCPTEAICEKETFPNDVNFKNPIAAFDAGVTFAGGDKK